MSDEQGKARAPLKPNKGKPTRALIRNPERTTPGELTAKENEIPKIAAEGKPQTRVVYSARHYEYEAPFLYDNVNCELGRYGTGTGPHPDGMELDIPPFGAVTIEETEPIIGVTVIGSPCIPPGTILVWGEPLEWKYGRSGVKFKRDNIWGEHLYRWGANPEFEEGNRHAGLAGTHFEIPDCSKITIMGYGQLDVHVSPPEWTPGKGAQNLETYSRGSENWWNDAHFNIRTVRIAVRVPEE